MIANFKDPEGCHEFRILLQDFDRNISSISKENKRAASLMQRSLEIFD
jgi:hypothetical protein